MTLSIKKTYRARPAALLPLCLLLLTIFGVTRPASAEDNKIKIDPVAAQNYRTLAHGVQAARIRQTVSALSGLHYTLPAADGAPAAEAVSRVAGTPGGDQARAYVLNQFQQIFGAANVTQEDYPVTIPVDEGSSIAGGGKTYRLRPLWPNLVRTSTLPTAGVTGPLIYAGRGDLRSFRGKDVSGSIVLLDFNCGAEWLNAPRLGARAVVFIEPSQTMRGEAEAKFIGIPVSIPRFWISRADAAALQAGALTTPKFQVTLHSNNPWEVHTASNIIGRIPGSDPKLKEQTVILESYYDSMSVVPTLAPGAESAGGIASLLELARLYKQTPPARTLVFVANGAHYLGIQGVREYINRHLDSWAPPSAGDRLGAWLSHKPLPSREQVLLFSGLDLSSQTNGVGVFHTGYFYNAGGGVQSNYSDIGNALRNNAAKIGQVLGINPDTAFADGINGVNGKNWQNYLPGQFAFDAEAAMMAGGRGITFATINDGRQNGDTPADTLEKVNVANLAAQTRLLACQYWHLFNDTNDPNDPSVSDPQSVKGIMPVAQWPAWTRQGLQVGFCRLDGSVLLFDPKRNFVPDQPVADSLAVVNNPYKTMIGVRGNLIQATEGGPNKASFAFAGLPLVISGGTGLRQTQNGPIQIGAYHLSEADGNRGDIDYAPDQGVNGAANYPTSFDLSGPDKRTQVIVFPCVATSIFDLIDQGSLKTLTGVQVLDGITDAEPRQYGFLLAGAEPNSSYVEDVAVLFSMAGDTTRLKVIMNSGPGAARFLLINSVPWDQIKNLPEKQRPCQTDRQCAQGIGYQVGVEGDVVKNGSITSTDLRVAQDMWHLDDFRLRQLAKYRIVNLDDTVNPVTVNHKFAAEAIAKAVAALKNLDYESFDAYSRQAWGYEARVYPQAQLMAQDVVQGVIFYLFLLIPFAYFLERLFFSKPDLKSQVGYAFLIFLVIFAVFSQIHPAFDITINPIIVLIAFVMLALSVIVSLMVWNKFEEQLKAFNQTVSGVHKSDVSTGSIAFAAFALGISNMRRRKERTLLTCITLILLTFTVLSFTSIVNYTRINDVLAPGSPLYQGILLRDPKWQALQLPAYRLLNDEFGRQYSVAPRAWFFGTQPGQQSFLALQRGDYDPFNLKGVVGFTPQEKDVTHLDKSLLAGRWFLPTDSYAAILPKNIADKLGVGLNDVGKVTVDFSGTPFTVIGIVDPDQAKAVKDLDNENITPADFQASQQQSNSSASASAASAGFQEYQHLDAGNVIFVPYETLINMGGSLQSVAINFLDKDTADKNLHALIPRLDLNLYGGIGTTNHRFSAIGSSQSSGFLTVLIPILIASLIVLNTMLGSVFERVKEIAIFSSIGLSPGNIAMLFIAEALVYGIIGAVSGYLIGQILAKLITVFHILPGLYLNFSSTSAVVSIMIVIGVVLLSTIFPARKASQVATPAVDRTWKLPEPNGDTWTITLPFAVSGVQANGINEFLAEWFSSFSEQSVGDFLTQGTRTSIQTGDGPNSYHLHSRVWLAPFDLGVSQDIALDTVPTELEGVYAVHLTLTRLSGDVSNWQRINRRFLNVVRKQFLIWRTLNAEQRERYMEMDRVPASV